MLLYLAGNGTIEFDEFVKMMLAKNRTGESRWDRSQKKAEPESWRAFKVLTFSLVAI